MGAHFKNVCKCGDIVSECRCPGTKEIRIENSCGHLWANDIEKELDEQYDIASYSVKGKSLEVDLPASRQSLVVTLTNVYGFVVTLYIYDETGGSIKDIDLYTCVAKKDLAETISTLYNSY